MHTSPSSQLSLLDAFLPATLNALNQLTAGLGFSGSLVYDRRGNLLSIGSAGSGKAFAYDHENQCTTAGGFNAYNKSDFVYDGKGRLRRRIDYTWNGSSWSYSTETRYIYDGMLLLQERTSAGHPAVTYTRGLDLNGSLAGAGGIGGLLARTAHQSTSPYQPSTHACYHADGNGNVTYLLRQDRTHGASYRYDPYGRLIASSGGLATANALRFSSKEWHASAGLYYYGYSFYLPEGQRWLNRDPIGESGGINLYAFVRNLPVGVIDPDGRFSLVKVTIAVTIVAVVTAGGLQVLNRACGVHRDGWIARARQSANDVVASQTSNTDQLHGIDNGLGDALLHCIARCGLTRDPGPCCSSRRALDSLQGRENRDNDDVASVMDRSNNIIGHEVGLAGSDPQNCVKDCIDALN